MMKNKIKIILIIALLTLTLQFTIINAADSMDNPVYSARVLKCVVDAASFCHYYAPDFDTCFNNMIINFCLN